MDYVVGQRWASLMEPELGIAIVTKIEGARIHLSFSESKVTRVYSIVSAPIKRIEFKSGDIITDKAGKSITVKNVEEKNGLLIYHSDETFIKESDLSGLITFNSPLDRLLSKKFDPTDVFDLRYQSLLIKNRILKSDIHGFVGGKIDLIAHQIYIAHEVSERIAPRILLADEVGLGKTIEACLILHNLIITGQISRVLVIVPESLVYQWFTELMHRFNMVFRIVSARYCADLKNAGNPFLDGELCITSVNFLSKSIKSQKDAIDAGWDMIIVDEAHNIKENTSEFFFINKLAGKTERVLLLTATPEQLGPESHFARLKILDPDRYSDYNEFLKESEDYKTVSKMVETILSDKKLSEAESKTLSRFLGSDYFDFFRSKESIIEDLLDRHGIGRVMFRNTRKTIKSFPKRIANLVEVKNKVDFVYDLLMKNKEEKFLLICHTKEMILELGNALKKKADLKISYFHEDLKVIERDRNASWFSLSEGAQILLCSEIGSEGRNFQFASNLILFDLPSDPEILEQRIGRLDRIGQKKSINIYVPYISGSKEEVFARWYHFGLNAFETNIPDGVVVFEKFNEKLEDFHEHYNESRKIFENEIGKLITETQNIHKKNIKVLEDGKDKLLELSSFNHKKSDELLSSIKDIENDTEIEEFMHGIFDYFGIEENAIGHRTYILTPGNVKTDAFPKIDEEGTVISYDRHKALKHEKTLFMNPDHPYVNRSIDLMLGGDYGNASIALWYSNETENIFLETVFALECVAPEILYINRFLPPAPIRIVLDIDLNDYSEEYSFDFFESYLKNDKLITNRFLNDDDFFKNKMPFLIEKSKQKAENKMMEIIEKAVLEMKKTLNNEKSRLLYLQKINPSVKDTEIESITERILELEKYMKESRLRFDAIRIVLKRKLEN